MNNRAQHSLWLAVVIVSLAGFGAAQADDDVYVYTNADLETLEPIPTQSAPLFEEPLGWDEVQTFISTHHGRLQDERRYQLERSLIQAEPRYEQQPRYGLAIAPWNFRARGKSRARRILEMQNTDYANRIVPLHARQSLIQPLLNDRARNRGRSGSGLDAIPVRPKPARPSVGNSRPRPRSATGPGFNTATER